MKRILLALATWAWNWLRGWFESPAGRRAVAAFLTDLVNQLPMAPWPATWRPFVHVAALALLSTGVLHASRQGPESK